jgi:hypothetical protein
MAKKITAWRDDSGDFHETKAQAESAEAFNAMVKRLNQDWPGSDEIGGTWFTNWVREKENRALVLLAIETAERLERETANVRG